MTQNNDTPRTDQLQAPGPEDPRFAFAKVTDAVGNLIEATSADMMGNPTPCSEFTVKELLEHLVLVLRRVAAIGQGEHWSTVTEVPTDTGWAQDYRAAAHDVMLAWSDPAILERNLEVPWGEFPGSLLMYTYTAELAVHGWDLSTATNAAFAIDDELLTNALIAAKFIPAEGRNTAETPFSSVVDPGVDAPVLDQIAGWMGRSVLSSS